MQHPAAGEAQQVVLADRLGGRDPVAREPLGQALRGQAGLGRLHAHQRVAHERPGEALGVAVADLAFGHRLTISAPRPGATDWRTARPADRLAG